MKKTNNAKSGSLNLFYELIYSSAFCCGMILLIKGWLQLSYTALPIFLSVFFLAPVSSPDR